MTVAFKTQVRATDMQIQEWQWLLNFVPNLPKFCHFFFFIWFCSQDEHFFGDIYTQTKSLWKIIFVQVSPPKSYFIHLWSSFPFFLTSASSRLSSEQQLQNNFFFINLETYSLLYNAKHPKNKTKLVNWKFKKYFQIYL